MPRIQVEALVSADRDQLYRLAEDFTRRMEWDRFVARVRYDHGTVTSTVGFAGAAHLLNPFRMRVEHVSLAYPSLIAINMLDGPRFLSKVKNLWRFETTDTEKTKVVLTSEFTSRWPLLDFVADPILSKVIARDLARELDDFKLAAENTDLVEKRSCQVV